MTETTATIVESVEEGIPRAKRYLKDSKFYSVANISENQASLSASQTQILVWIANVRPKLVSIKPHCNLHKLPSQTEKQQVWTPNQRQRHDQSTIIEKAIKQRKYWILLVCHCELLCTLSPASLTRTQTTEYQMVCTNNTLKVFLIKRLNKHDCNKLSTRCGTLIHLIRTLYVRWQILLFFRGWNASLINANWTLKLKVDLHEPC